MKITTTLSLSFLLGASFLPAANAQQTTGVLGSSKVALAGARSSSLSSSCPRPTQGNRDAACENV
jgi:hypothetical protein